MLQTQRDWCIGQVVPACLRDVSLPWFKDEATETYLQRWKQRDVLLKVFFCASGFLIKESTVSLSLEIYRILTVFSFFSVHLLWHSSISVLRMLFSLFSLRHQDYIMARRRMHSFYIQWMPQWNGMKNSCFSVTKSAAFMHPRAWHSWALGTSSGVLWTWNIFFYVPFFSLCSLCLFLSPLSSNGFPWWSRLAWVALVMCVAAYVGVSFNIR